MEKVNIKSRTLLGISTDTSYDIESNPDDSNIIKIVGKYWQQNIAESIPFRINPGIIYIVYSNYSSNFRGKYNYFIGEEVDAIEHIPIGLEAKIILPGSYCKIVSKPGKMPDIIISTWQEIWNIDENLLENHRAYQTDFEIHDQRFEISNSENFNKVFEIYLGIK